MIKFVDWIKIKEEGEQANASLDTSNSNAEVKAQNNSQCCSKDFKNWYYPKKKRRKN